ncbi:hypothetical protein WI23_30180 [Burkholderia oklahomensis C6786]|nr:hypothetical protein WI23_30180 [Burkholderia oklahomensis C6786]KUY53117.1 hypothetical protein WI23_23270 [Burkholderia oklahomensis C6786]KUY65131.1 hypothetical protein WG70_28370 [Burkholderia oklahomensis EO147]
MPVAVCERPVALCAGTATEPVFAEPIDISPTGGDATRQHARTDAANRAATCRPTDTERES